MTERALEAFFEALGDDNPEDLYERAPCGFLSTRMDGTILKVNETFLTWTGHSREELVGRKRFSDLLTGGGRIYHETHYAPMLAMQGSVREIALDIVCAGGRRLPAILNSVAVETETGAQLIRTVIFDATERRSYENELLLAKRRAEDAEAKALVLARTLQQTLIPPATPHIEGLELAAQYRPAGSGAEVGGDFYDVFQLAPDDWMIVLGDICGKGVEAAVLTALARYTTRGAAMQDPSPSRVLRALNEVLLQEGSERFATVVAARLQRSADRWVLTVSAGGHPLPLVTRPGGSPQSLGRYGSLLGSFEDPTLEDSALDLGSGDSVVFFTDGVTEGRGKSGFYGERRLEAAVAKGGSAAEVANRITDEVVDFQEGSTSDDIAVVAFRVL